MLLVFILFLLFVLMGMPVAFAFGISGVAFFLLNSSLPLTIPVQLVLSQTQSFLLLAIPLFVLAGNLLNETSITERVMKLTSVLTGHMRAGLAQSNMVLAAAYAGASIAGQLADGLRGLGDGVEGFVGDHQHRRHGLPGLLGQFQDGSQAVAEQFHRVVVLIAAASENDALSCLDIDRLAFVLGG